MRKSVAILGLVALSMVVTPGAEAVTITPSTSTFTIAFNGTEGDVNDDPPSFLSWLTATAVFTVTAWSGNTVAFDIALTNNTAAPYGSSVSALGFNVSPDFTSAAIGNGSVFGQYDVNGTLEAHQVSAVYGTYDLCVFVQGCNGGQPNKGVLAGETEHTFLTLTFATPPTQLVLDKFFVRYQSLTFNGQNYESGSGAGLGTCTALDDEDDCTPPPPCTRPDGCDSGDPIPEPALLTVVGLGLLGAGFARRRRP